MVACIVAIVIGFIFAFITAWELLYKNGMTKCCEKSCRDWAKCLKWRKCLDLTLKFINAIFLVIAVIVSNNTKTFFTDLADDECSDTNTNKILSDFAGEVRDFVFTKNVRALIVFCLMIIVEILKFVYMKIKGNKDNEKERKNDHSSKPYNNINNASMDSSQQNQGFNQPPPVPANNNNFGGAPQNGGIPSNGYNNYGQYPNNGNNGMGQPYQNNMNMNNGQNFNNPPPNPAFNNNQQPGYPP